MTKTYRLTYESVEVMHALFDKTSASQGFRISSRILREYTEHFGPKTEQLDLVAQEGKVVFTSFTEKPTDQKGTSRPVTMFLTTLTGYAAMLAAPLETAIAIHTEDFEDFHMQEDLHIVINVNDFRAIAIHAETLRGPVTARFSYPNRPLQFDYQNFGIHSEFTLMTTGDRRAGSSAPKPDAKYVSTRPNGTSSSRQPSIAPMQGGSRTLSEQYPPSRTSASKPLSSQSQRAPLGQQARTTSGTVAVDEEDPDPDSLFVPDGGADDDQAWDAANYDNDEDEMLGWDASNDNFTASMRPTIRDLSGRGMAPQTGRDTQDPEASRPQRQANLERGIDPTQRLSQVSISSNMASTMAFLHIRIADPVCTSFMECSIDRYVAQASTRRFSRTRIEVVGCNNEARCATCKDGGRWLRHGYGVIPTFDVALVVNMHTAIAMFSPTPCQDFAVLCQSETVFATSSDSTEKW